MDKFLFKTVRPLLTAIGYIGLLAIIVYVIVWLQNYIWLAALLYLISTIGSLLLATKFVKMAKKKKEEQDASEDS